jgi:glycosyltransferase involved in cell wall biosynthesis
MNLKELTVLSFSYGRNLFDQENLESKRMQRFAESFAQVHTIIFALQKEQLTTRTYGHLTLHPTNSSTRFLYVWDAFRIGMRLLRRRTGSWVLVAQDPFELGALGLVLSRVFAVPFSVQEHGDFYSRPFWRRDTYLNRVRWVLGLFVLRHADTVRAVSVRIAEALRARGIPAERIFTLPVRTDAFDAPRLRDIDSMSGLRSEGTLTILTMARLVPQKNLPLLIDAFKDVVAVAPHARLVIVGKGPLESSLRARVHYHRIVEKVTFVPWTDTPREYLQNADIYALSSDWEGWARVLIEAMHEGVPIVTTDVGCAREVLKDGVHGIVVPPRDREAFARALRTLVENPALRSEYGEAARRDVSLTHQTSEEYAEAQARILEATYRIAQNS